MTMACCSASIPRSSSRIWTKRPPRLDSHIASRWRSPISREISRACSNALFPSELLQPIQELIGVGENPLATREVTKGILLLALSQRANLPTGAGVVNQDHLPVRGRDALDVRR